MPIVTDLGIHTEELCVDSKRYLSYLLVGKTGINPNFLTWNLLLTEEFNLNASIRAYHQENLSKENIIDKLIKLECENIQKEYLESRKQQAELRSKKLGLISIGIIIGLAIGFPFVLPLLGTTATLVGVLCLGIGATLICCSIIPAFFGERLIDQEWHNDYAAREKELTQPIKEKITGTYDPVVIEAEVEAEPETSRLPIQKTSTQSNTSISNIVSRFFHHAFKSTSNSKQNSLELPNSVMNP